MKPEDIARGMSGLLASDRLATINDQEGSGFQQYSLEIMPDGTVQFFNFNQPTGFASDMVTIQAIPEPGGGIVGPVSIWLHARTMPGVSQPFVVLFDSQPRQFFIGKQFLNPAARNDGANAVRINITTTESI